MHIAYVVHKFPPDSLGGVETYSWSLARVLAKLGHAVHVFYPRDGSSETACPVELDGIRLWRAPIPLDRPGEGAVSQFWHTFRDSAVEASFQRFLRAAEPDVVHFQHVQGVSVRLIELVANLPHLATLHDYWFLCPNSQLLRPDGQLCNGSRFGWDCVDCLTIRQELQWLRVLRPLVAVPLAYRNGYLRRVLESVPLLLAPSEFLRQKYLEHGFRAERLQKVDLGLDRERLNVGSGAQAAESSDRPRSGPHFGFLGSLAPHKGLHVLVEAFNRLPDSACLTIYGNEHALPEYVSQLKARTVHPNVRFAGPVDHREVGSALRRLDCLVVPSIWYENSPMVIQEAYGAGIPVVASRLGALVEKVNDGETGLLFSPGNSMDLACVLRELVDHPERLDVLRANIRPPVTMQEHARKMLAIYRAQLDRYSP